MALTEEQLELLGDRLVPLFQELERAVINDVARRLTATGKLTETAEIMAETLRDKGYSPSAIYTQVMRAVGADELLQREIAINTRQLKAQIVEEVAGLRERIEGESDMWVEVGNMAFRNDLSVWKSAAKPVKGSAFEKLVEAAKKRATDEVLNLTKSLGFHTSTGMNVRAERIYRHELNLALTKVCSGAYSFDQAVEEAVREMAKSGLRVVDFESGVTRQIDTAARNAVRTAASQLAGEISMQNARDTDCNHVEVSAHWGAREGEGHANHAGWQGKIYCIEGTDGVYENLEQATGYPSDPKGLKGYNCRHDFYPFWPGLSEPNTWPPEPEPVTVNGRRYTYYQATQEQRRRERGIRALKREESALKSAGLDDKAKEDRGRIRTKTAEYREFSDAVGIRPKENRLRVCEGGDVARTAKTLKNPPKSSIIEVGDGDVYMRILDASGNEKYRYLQTDAIQKLDSSGSMKEFFTYTDRWDEERSPIDDSFLGLKTPVQKEAAEGIEWVRRTLGIKTLPTSIKVAKLKPGAVGEYRENSRTICFRKSLKVEEAFATAVHEMIHFVDHECGYPAEVIGRQAMNNLGLRINTKKAKNLVFAIGGYAMADGDMDWHELLAYSLERYATNKGNELSNEISRLLIERMKK